MDEREKKIKKIIKDLQERTGMDTSTVEKELIPHTGEETGLKIRKRRKI